MGRKAVDLLFKETTDNIHIVLDTKLVERDSVYKYSK